MRLPCLKTRLVERDEDALAVHLDRGQPLDPPLLVRARQVDANEGFATSGDIAVVPLERTPLAQAVGDDDAVECATKFGHHLRLLVLRGTEADVPGGEVS